MKLIRTDAVFNRTTMVLFLCRNKSSRNGTKLCEDFYINNKNFWSQDLPERGTWVGTTHQGAPPPPGAPRWLSLPGGPADPKTYAIKSYFPGKKTGKKNYRIHKTEPPRSPVLPWEGRYGVRLGLRRGGSSFFVITNPSPSPIP